MIFFLLSLTLGISARSTGSPVCEASTTELSKMGASANPGPAGYSISASAGGVVSGGTVTITIAHSTPGTSIGGLLLYARNPGQQPVGEFQAIPLDLQALSACSATTAAGLTHTNKAAKPLPFNLMWKAPLLAGAEYNATFSAAVVDAGLGKESWHILDNFGLPITLSAPPPQTTTLAPGVVTTVAVGGGTPTSAPASNAPSPSTPQTDDGECEEGQSGCACKEGNNCDGALSCVVTAGRAEPICLCLSGAPGCPCAVSNDVSSPGECKGDSTCDADSLICSGGPDSLSADGDVLSQAWFYVVIAIAAVLVLAIAFSCGVREMTSRKRAASPAGMEFNSYSTHRHSQGARRSARMSRRSNYDTRPVPYSAANTFSSQSSFQAPGTRPAGGPPPPPRGGPPTMGRPLPPASSQNSWM